MSFYEPNVNGASETSTVAAAAARPRWRRPIVLIPAALGVALLGILAASLFSTFIGGDGADTSAGAPVIHSAEVSQTADDPATADATADQSDSAQPAPQAQHELNSIQSEARDLAASYLESRIYSRLSLIDALVDVGYRETDATAAIDSLKVDWNDQAVQAAEIYVEKFEFTRTGLIAQLEVDGFESHQAQYGAAAVGL